MEDAWQETQNPPEKHFSGALLFITIFLVVYFLFPMIFLYPLYFVYRHRPPPPRVQATIEVIFYPDIELSVKFPAYRELLNWEGRLLGMDK